MYNKKKLLIRKNRLDIYLNRKILNGSWFCFKENHLRVVKQKNFNQENPVPNLILPRRLPGI